MDNVPDSRAFSLFNIEKESDHEGTRTLNLPIRSRTPYPLGHAVNHMKAEIFNTLHYIQGQMKTIILQIFTFADRHSIM